MAEGSWPKSDGDVLYASEVNNFHNPIQQIYTGTDLDGRADTDGGTTKSVELDQVTSINDRNYAKIDIFADIEGSGGGSVTTPYETASLSVKIEIKEIGGSYSTLFDETLISTSGGSVTKQILRYLTYTHELTAGQKTNGFQFKVSISYVFSSNNGNADANFTNDQIIVSLT